MGRSNLAITCDHHGSTSDCRIEAPSKLQIASSNQNVLQKPWNTKAHNSIPTWWSTIPKRKGVSQPSFFRGHVELPGYHKDCCSSWWTPPVVNQYHGMRYSLFFTRASEIFDLCGYLNRLELRWVSSDIRVLHLNSNTLDILGTCHKNLNVRDTSTQDAAKKNQWLENWSCKAPNNFARTRVKRVFFCDFCVSGICNSSREPMARW